MRTEFWKLLYKGEYSITSDKVTFGEWERGIISTERCIKRFLKNNFIIENELDHEIEHGDFVRWLNSLGYHRTKSDR